MVWAVTLKHTLSMILELQWRTQIFTNNFNGVLSNNSLIVVPKPSILVVAGRPGYVYEPCKYDVKIKGLIIRRFPAQAENFNSL